MNKQLFNEVTNKFNSLDVDVSNSLILSNLFLEISSLIGKYLELRVDNMRVADKEIETLLLIKLFLLSIEFK